MSTTEKRPRKPAARHRDVVIGAMEEVLRGAAPSDTPYQWQRMAELVDELKRSLNGKGNDDE